MQWQCGYSVCEMRPYSYLVLYVVPPDSLKVLHIPIPPSQSRYLNTSRRHVIRPEYLVRGSPVYVPIGGVGEAYDGLAHVNLHNSGRLTGHRIAGHCDF